MKKPIAILAAVFTLSLLPAALPAQNSPAPPPAQHFYRMHFSVEEINGAGHATNTRSYVETISTANGREQQIKTGSKVPVATGSFGSKAVPVTQFQYIDLGVDLGVLDPKEHGDMLSFRLMANVSSIARQAEVAGTGEPVIRQNTWDSTVTVPIGKPTIVFSSDDLDSTGKMQIEVTATRVD
jgi:Bacterial type II and III secretion system protein